MRKPAPSSSSSRPWLALVGALTAGLATAPAAAEPAAELAAAAAARPNVIVIVADDLGYGDVGFNGGRDLRTPRLDALAKSGVVATEGYVAASVCSPSRAGLMTGRYPQRFGHENNIPEEPGNNNLGLPVAEKTIGDVMKAAGYATGAIGKWHLGQAPVFHPNRRGFDEFFGFLGGMHDYLPGRASQIERNGVPVKETRYLTNAFGDEAADFVKRHRNEPFFLYLAFNAPHTPMQAPPGYLARFANIADPTRRTYAAMVSALDDAIGHVADTLAENNLERRTLVVFLSDNGANKTYGGSNAPLKNGKASLYEGGVRIPFFLRWPGTLPAGRSDDRPIISLDILPTAAAVAGANPATKPLDGVNLLPYLRGTNQGQPHDALFWRRKGSAAVRVARWKLIEPKDNDEKMYDLATDPDESADLLSREDSTATTLETRLAAWNRQLVPPLW
ncbi:MAG: sulfatase-like hydrolase/transferase [Rhodospirillales bacterium]